MAGPQYPSIESGRAWTATRSQDVLPRIPPRERTVVEGNLVEHPIWKLTNKQARPLRTVVDEKTGKTLKLPDPRDYTLTIDLALDPDARTRRQL